MTRFLSLVAFLALCLVMLSPWTIFPALAMAAEAVPAEAPAQAWTILLWLNTTQGIIFTVAALWVLREAARRYVASQQLKDDDVVRKYLMGFLDIAVSATFARLGPGVVLATAAGTATAEQMARRETEIRQQALDTLATVGDAAKHFGITETGLRERISRRLDARAGDILPPFPIVRPETPAA